MKNKALFLDRDGIINIDKSYVYRFEDIEWNNGIIELIQTANQYNFLVIVLTNQSGVAQGIYKEEDVLLLHKKMTEYLIKNGAKIDDWFYCPDYSTSRRKPNPGMMIEARNKYNIDLNESFMIGDKVSDVLDIKGPKTFLLRGNYALDSLPSDKDIEIYHSIAEIHKRFVELATS